MTDVTAWRKSTRSGSDNNSDCVELRRARRAESEGFHLRDSKLGDASPIFDLRANDFRALLGAIG